MDTFEKYLTEFSMDWTKAIKYKEQNKLPCCDNCEYAEHDYEHIYCRNIENIKTHTLFDKHNDIYVRSLGICPKFRLSR